MNKLLILTSCIALCLSCKKAKEISISDGFLNEWKKKSYSYINSHCGDSNKISMMKRFFRMPSCVERRKMILSECLAKTNGRDMNIQLLENISENSNSHSIVVSGLLENKIIELSFNLTDDKIKRRDTTVLEGESIFEIECKNSIEINNACPYIIGTHNPELSIYSNVSLVKGDVQITKVCLMLN